MFKTDGSLVHPLEINGQNIPDEFTYPFYYEPHPLTVLASKEIQNYLQTQQDFKHNFGLDPSKKGLPIGKMFGVMIIKQPNGDFGYLASFSGKLAESNHLKGFVPPVYDTLKPDGFYKKGEARLNELNKDISILEEAEALLKAKDTIKQIKIDAQKTLEDFKKNAKRLKKERQKKRIEAAQLPLQDLEAALEVLRQQSIASNIRLKYLKRELNTAIAKAEQDLQELELPIKELKTERQQLSAMLQKQIHDQYQFYNYRKEVLGLTDIFKATGLGDPPAAAGECAAPKLFQFAYKNDLTPIAMAEFWWGISPNSEIRKHKHFYPSCRGKCEPILGFMMQGLNVAPNPMEHVSNTAIELKVIYEDEYILLVNKPHEFLSVPGKTIKDSVLTRMKSYLHDATGPLLLHRLDMSTSGLLLVAKTKRSYKKLQKQFISRTVKKRYVAILHGEYHGVMEGNINLPLRVDLNDRPRQLVCYEHGKPATTEFKVIEIRDNSTRIHFYPITGRTHQLRVHAAHKNGLNLPIAGDDLYGIAADRLYLHAESIAFEHPVKGEWMTFKSPAPF